VSGALEPWVVETGCGQDDGSHLRHWGRIWWGWGLGSSPGGVRRPLPPPLATPPPPPKPWLYPRLVSAGRRLAAGGRSSGTGGRGAGGGGGGGRPRPSAPPVGRRPRPPPSPSPRPAGPRGPVTEYAAGDHEDVTPTLRGWRAAPSGPLGGSWIRGGALHHQETSRIQHSFVVSHMEDHPVTLSRTNVFKCHTFGPSERSTFLVHHEIVTTISCLLRGGVTS